MFNNDSVFLGIDFGNSKTGIAISKLGICIPFTTIYEKNIKKLAEVIKKIVNEKNIKRIIIGYPKNSNEILSTECEKINKLSKILEKKTNIKNVLWDESLSTYEAKIKLNESGLKFKKKKKFEDEEAAKIILESYLEYLNRINLNAENNEIF